MPSCNTYHRTRVSLTLGVGYLFTAAPAKHSRCSLPWVRGISLPPLFLTFNMGDFLQALLCLHSHHYLGCSSRPRALALGSGWLLRVTAPGLGREVDSPGRL